MGVVILVPSASSFRYFATKMARQRSFDRRRTALWVAALAGSALMAAAASQAVAQEPETKAAVKGRIMGGNQLLNPVWNDDKDPKNRRYTFRQPSTTVGKNAKTLTAYLPKELAIAALFSPDGGDAPKNDKAPPFDIHVSGGRTTPVTIVIAPGRSVQFVNHDPFTHKLYSVDKGQGSLAPEETKSSGQRVWQPPKAGVYEIRDAYFPSVRSWIVVEPKAVSVGYPNTKNEFVVPDLPPGNYEFRAYFAGAAVGEPLPFELRPGRDLQELPKPLVVAKGKAKDDKDAGKGDDDKKEDKKEE